MHIVNDDLSHPAVKALLAEHMRGMVEHSPPGSIHSLDLAGLRSPNISFWTGALNLAPSVRSLQPG